MSKESSSCTFKTSIGGQALIEGILMRGPQRQAIVCRTEDGLVEKTDDVTLLKDRYPFFGLPLVRGCVTFIDSLVKGMQALTYSASLIPLEQQGEPDKIDEWITRHFPEEKAEKLIISVAVVLGILRVSVYLPSHFSCDTDQAPDPLLFGSKSVGGHSEGNHSSYLYVPCRAYE